MRKEELCGDALRPCRSRREPTTGSARPLVRLFIRNRRGALAFHGRIVLCPGIVALNTTMTCAKSRIGLTRALRMLKVGKAGEWLRFATHQAIRPPE